MAEEHTPNEVLLTTNTENELSEKDRQFVKRFNLQPEDLRYKILAEQETETQ